MNPKIEFVINLQTANALGLTIASESLYQANRLIRSPRWTARTQACGSRGHPTFFQWTLQERDIILLVISRRLVRMPAVVCHDVTR